MYARTGAGPPAIEAFFRTRLPVGCRVVLGTPTRPDAPPGRASAEGGLDGLPEADALEHRVRTVLDQRADLLDCFLSALSGSTSVAPKSRPSATRSGLLPSRMIRSAPSRFDAITPHSPTAPSPTTATVVTGSDLRRERGMVAACP